MGEVYDVRDTSTGYAYALKLYRPEVSQRPDAIPAFEREARKVGELGIDTFARSYEFGVDPQTGCPFSLGELVLLPSLQQMIATQGPVSINVLDVLMRTLAPAFDKAHQAGLAHRGLKPSNIFASEVEPGTWQARVTEFGQSALRVIAPPPPGWTASPGWLSAEQADPSTPASASMDVYALGLVAFFALTGRSVFRSMQSVPPDLNHLWAEMTAPLPPASARARELGVIITATLDPWFARALSVSPMQRFHSVGEMSQALWGIVGSSQHVVTMRPPPGVGATPPPMPPMGQKPPSPQQLRSMKQTLMYGMQAPASGVPGGPSGAAVPGVPQFIDQDDDDMPTRAISREQFEQQAMARPSPGPNGGSQYPDVPPPPMAPPPGPAVSTVPSANAMGQQPVAAAGAPPEASLTNRPPPARSPYLMPALAAAGVLLIGAIVIGGIAISRSSSSEDQPPAKASATASAPAPSATPSAVVAAPSATPSASAAPPPPKDALVKLSCEPACDTIKCDGKAVSDASSGVRLDPGKHECKGSKKGYTTATETFEVKAGDEISKTLALTKVAVGGGTYVPPANTTPPTKTGGTKTPGPAKTCGTFLNPCK